MSGSTGAVSVGRGGARPAASELDSGSGAAIHEWPLVSALPPLAALPTAPACARGHVRAVAREWDVPGELTGTAELLTSELVTNAVQASQRLTARADLPVSPVVRVWLLSDWVSIVINVWDGCEEMPVRHDAAPDEIGGRGLMIVSSLCSEWGAYRKERGKVIWAVLR